MSTEKRQDFLPRSPCHLLLVISAARYVHSHNLSILRQNLPTSKKIMDKTVGRKKRSQSTCKQSVWELFCSVPVQLADPPPGHTAATCSLRKSMQFPFPFCFIEVLKQEILPLLSQILFTAKLTESTSSPCTLVLLKRTKGNVILQACSQHFKVEIKPAPV